MLPKVRNVNTLAAGYTPSSMQDVGSCTLCLRFFFFLQHSFTRIVLCKKCFYHGSVDMIEHYVLYQIEKLVN